jgi:alpha-mannosidase
MNKYSAVIYAFPVKSSVRESIVFIPGKLNSHKIIKTCFFKNLRKISIVAKYIRQPAYFHILIKFFKKEFLLHDIEVIGSYAYLKGYEYPQVLLEMIWKEVLLYQFHDIIPGSSIKRVYDESKKRYAEMIEELEAIKQSILNFLSIGEAKTFINTSSFKREEYIKSENEWYMIKANAYSTSPMIPVNKIFDLKFGGNFIENEFFKAIFSEKGYIISLHDKANNMETCGNYLNKLTLYTDKWKYFNAWDIDINYPKRRKTLLQLIKSETFIDGPRVIRRNFYRHGKTTLSQDVILTSGKQYIEFDTNCDYQETFKMLRADFATSIYSDNVKCDIQFGSFDRSTKDDTSIEKAQFEICAHKWVDLSNEEYGISLINDCKYGHRVKDGIISLNLLRSPVYPDPTADRGEHKFKYAFYPHKGNVFDSDTIEESYLFNMTPIICENNISFDSLVSTDKKNIIVETIKKAEKENALIIRLYECFGENAIANISTSIEYTEVFDTDMLENIISKTNLNNLLFTPFEIKTILLKLK